MTNIKKIKNDPQAIFNSIDEKVSSLYNFLGFKKFAKVLPISDPLYWNNILNKIRLSICVLPIFFILMKLYSKFLLDKLPDEGFLGNLYHYLPSFLFWCLLCLLFGCYVVVDNFSQGKEKLKGNDKIQIIHLYYMFILPILFVMAVYTPLML